MYRVQVIGEGVPSHSFTVGKKGDRVQTLLDLDLSDATFFSQVEIGADGQPEQRSVLLHPLGESARDIFEQLEREEGIDRHKSLIVRELRDFGRTRLAELIDLVNTPAPEPYVAREDLARLFKDPKRAERALSKVVSTIDQKLPGYFLAEKEIGSFKWLASGCGGAAPCRLGQEVSVPEALDRMPRGFLVLFDETSQRIKYGFKSQTAYTLAEQPPSTFSVLSSLCEAGTLGREIVELNEGMLLHSASKAIGRRLLQAQPERTRDISAAASWSAKLVALIQSTGARALSLFGQAGLGALRNMGSIIPTRPRVLGLRVFALSIIDHYVATSGGRQGAILGGNYSPNSKIVAANSSLNELIFAVLLSCHPLVGGAFFW